MTDIVQDRFRWKWKATLTTETINMNMDGITNGYSDGQVRAELKQGIADQFNATVAQVDITRLTKGAKVKNKVVIDV